VDVERFVVGLFDQSRDVPAFQTLLRDFLVQMKVGYACRYTSAPLYLTGVGQEFTAGENAGLYEEEKRVVLDTQRAEEMKRQQAVPGLAVRLSLSLSRFVVGLMGDARDPRRRTRPTCCDRSVGMPPMNELSICVMAPRTKQTIKQTNKQTNTKGVRPSLAHAVKVVKNKLRGRRSAQQAVEVC
jgi:hypothetical protein